MKKPVKTVVATKGLAATFAALSERERKGLIGMGVVLCVLLLALVVGLFQRSLGELERDTQRYQQALSLLAVAGPAYRLKSEQPVEGSERLARFSEEVLTNNDLKLTSFVATHAAATNIIVSSYDEDQMPLGSKSKTDTGPIIIERQLRVDIRETQIDRLIELLDRIEKSREPVIVKRMDVRAQRNQPGTVRVLLVVSTYIRRDKET
ncbi:MAG: hypothetical protein H0U74_18020 [Bradymonadaceae bacterium]|nr:hypothetical protein [Lujinxingiaceae bacterium]